MRIFIITTLFLVFSFGTAAFAVTLECTYRSVYGDKPENNPVFTEYYDITQENGWTITENEFQFWISKADNITISRNTGAITVRQPNFGGKLFQGKCKKVDKSKRKF